MIKHKHHIIPKHAGGTDDPDNLVELTITEHAQAHLDLYHKYGNEYDQIAYRMLSGQIDVQEATRLAQVEAANRRWTPEARKAMSNKMKGEANMMRGREHSEGTKALMSEKQKATWTPEKRKKASDRRKGKTVWSASGADNPHAKSCVVDGIQYDTQQEAADVLGISSNLLRYRIKSESKKWSGYGI